MIRLCLMILVACVLAGCNRDAPAPTSDGIVTEVSDPETGVTVRTHIETDEIGIADRLRVEVRVEWTSPSSATLNEPDWADTQWTRIDGTIQPVELSDDGFVLVGEFLLEPFLAGTYEIPAFEVLITPDSDSPTRTLLSMTIPVQVLSVLDTEDAGVLEPASGFLDPSTPNDIQSKSKYGVFGIATVVFVVSAYIIWRLTRSAEPSTRRSAYELFNHVANGSDDTEAEAFDTLYQAFTLLDPRLQQTSEIQSMIQQCEQARFSPMGVGAEDPVSMARHTLELLGHCETEAA